MSTPSKVDFKVVLLGQERVGKTCIMQRFLYGRYREQSPVCLLCCRSLVHTHTRTSHHCGTDCRRCIRRKADAQHQEPHWRVYSRALGLPFLVHPVFSHPSLARLLTFVSANTTGHRRVGAVRGDEQDLLQVCQGCDHLLRFVVVLFFCSIPSLRHHALCLSRTDMTFAPSLKKVRFWADELKKQEPNCAIFIVGTKCLSISRCFPI